MLSIRVSRPRRVPPQLYAVQAKVTLEIRDLIRGMARENPSWGAPIPTDSQDASRTYVLEANNARAPWDFAPAAFAVQIKLWRHTACTSIKSKQELTGFAGVG